MYAGRRLNHSDRISALTVLSSMGDGGGHRLSPARRRAGRQVLHQGPKQPHLESGALTDPAIHLHLATHALGQGLDDGQPHAGAFNRCTLGPEAVEGLEQLLQLFRRHPSPGVADFQDHLAPRWLIGPGPHGHRTALPVVLDGV
jgi:hypothetical protein